MRTMEPFDPSTLPAVVGFPTVGQGEAQDSGLTNGCGALYFLNKSNVGINLVFEDGSRTILPAWFARVYVLKNKSNQLWMSQAYQLNTQGSPISMLYWEAMQQGEDTTGLYNGPLTYQTNIGGGALSQATSVVNDGLQAPVVLVESSPLNYPNPDKQSVLLQSDGSLLLQSFSNGSVNPSLKIIPGGPINYTVVQLDQGQIATDGHGGLTVIGLAAAAPVTLRASNQETGQCGTFDVAGAAAQSFGHGVNFKTQMTNVPTGITLSTTFALNESGQAASGITINGFLLSYQSAAAGATHWYGAYTTVGN